MRIIDNSDARLILIPTPLGNLGDITRRAAEIIADVDYLFCEDTRRTKILLKSLGISRALSSIHSHNEEKRTHEVLSLLKNGFRIGYVSDSGTPGISDPGAALFRAAQREGFSATVFPGATAFVPAIVMSALPCDKFTFLGFAPASPTKRRRILRSIVDCKYTSIFYESPHRIYKFLTDCLNILGNRDCAIVREISKMHEEILQGTIEEMLTHFENYKARGEFVVILAGIR